MLRALSILSLLLAILSACLSAWIAYRVQGFNQPCTEDDTCALFSTSYRQARERFRTAAHAVEASVYPLAVIDEDFTIDVAVLKGNKPGCVIHTPGVHGVEGYAGSAIQLAFLQEELPIDRPTVMLVHAVNPFGMAHFRRTNENNVDLNRNALNQHPVDTHPNHDRYAKFDKTFNPQGPPTFFSVYVKSWFTMIRAVGLHGIPTLKAALVQGQYNQPKGISYGGSKLEPSLLLLRGWMLQQEITGVTTWIDVHTGLGPVGQDTLIPVDASSAAELDRWFPESFHPYGVSQEAKNVIQGYEEQVGGVHNYFEALLQPALALIQEFGTVPNLLVGHAVISENSAFQSLSAAEALGWALETTKRAFYPESSYWRHQVLERGVRLLRQAMDRSMVLSADMKLPNSSKEVNEDS